MDHIGRWVMVQTFLYPASGVAVTHICVGRWCVKRVRAMRPDEYR